MKGAAVWVVLAGVTAGGCARHAASQATEGAINTLREQSAVNARPGELPAAALAGQAVDGAISHLQDPAHLAALEAVAGSTASRAMQRAMTVATERLQGDLGAGMVETARKAALSATDGALHQIFPGCPDDDRRCLDRRITDLSRAAAAGFTRGIRDSLAIPALVLAFLAGAIVTMMVMMILSHASARRELRTLRTVVGGRIVPEKG
jgi:hypothetical protein